MYFNTYECIKLKLKQSKILYKYLHSDEIFI